MKRICYKCKGEFPIESFINKKTGSFGKGYECKDCCRIAYRERRERHIGTHKKKDRAYYERNREKIINKRKEYNKANKDKVSARSKIMGAVFTGKVIRPDSCSKCGIKCVPDAHHEDYKKPLDVIWLCRKCHQILHNGK
jgi:hypothetical protein